MRYTLTATLGNQTKQVLIDAADDTEATFEAVFKILDMAVNRPLWANGAIELRNPRGELINEMAAK